VIGAEATERESRRTPAFSFPGRRSQPCACRSAFRRDRRSTAFVENDVRDKANPPPRAARVIAATASLNGPAAQVIVVSIDLRILDAALMRGGA